MASIWMTLGYFLTPAGLLLLFMLEPASIFTFDWKKSLNMKTVAILVFICAVSFIVGMHPNFTLPGIYSLLPATAYAGLMISAFVMTCWQIGKQPLHFLHARRKRRMMVIGFLLLLLGSLNTFGHAVDRYNVAKRLSAEIDVAPVYLSAAQP